MDSRLLRRLPFLLALLACCISMPAAAQINMPAWNLSQWWRNGSTLDMDFLNDRYWLNGTEYSGIGSFITGSGATFTRQSSSISPAVSQYLANNQSFVSRSSVANSITSTSAPFYRNPGQAFVSRASASGNYTPAAPFYASATQAFVSRASYTSNITSILPPFYMNFAQSYVSRAAASSNVTVSNALPFYMASNQTFVSRAASSNNYTSTLAPFYLDTTQAFVSRASTARYFDNTGTMQTAATNTARTNYTYNGSSWVNSGTLIEAAATNLLTYSQDCGNAAWNKYFNATCTANVATAPDGTTTANLLTFDGTSNAQVAHTAVTVTNGATYTFSAWIKSDGTPPSSGYLHVNYGTGTAMQAFTPTSTWQRVSITFTAGATTVPPLVLSGNAVSFYMWGAQLEAGSVATSYMPTTSSTASRSADVFSQGTATYFDSTGTIRAAATNAARTNYTYNGSSWVNAGTLLEPNVTNLWTTSTAAWTCSACTSSTQSGTTPIGSTEVVMTEDNTNSLHQMSLGSTVSTNSTWGYTMSVFAKQTTTGRYASVSVSDGGSNGYYATYDLSNGTLVGSGVAGTGTFTRSDISNYGNGWYRISVFGAASSTDTGVIRPAISALPNTSYPAAYQGNGGAYIKFAGAQLEIAPYPTSLVPTVGSTAVRQADVYSQQAATYFDSTGNMQGAGLNVARTNYAYNGSSWINAGTLIEPAATNVVLNSDNINNWGSAGTTHIINTNKVTLPGGVGTAYSISSSVPAGKYQFVGNLAVGTYTISAFVKYVDGTGIIRLGSDRSIAVGGIPYLDFNTSTGLATNVTAAVQSYSITNVGSGWYRVALTFSTSSINNVPVSLYTGISNAASEVAVWGNQLEAGSVASSYIPTNTATVTRPADVYNQETATYFDNTGAMKPATTNAARTDYNPSTLALNGTLLEPAATNAIRNSIGSGAITGTPGTLPTYWRTSSIPGVASQVVGTGTESGIPYIDIRYVGTPTSNTVLGLYFESFTQYAATAGAVVTESAYLKLQSGSLANITNTLLAMANRDSAGSGLSEFATSAVNVPSTSLAKNRFSNSSTSTTFTNASTAYIVPYFQFNVTSGNAIDVTFRIGMPQMEAGSYSTSAIPTSGGAVTRAADIYNQETATYFDSTGKLQSAASGVSRQNYTYNGTSWVLGGTLIEPATTNLLTYSQDFTNAAWSKGGYATVTANATTSPAGINDAQKLADNAAFTGFKAYFQNNYTFTPGTLYTFSIYAKKAEYNYMEFQLNDGGTVNQYPVFNISTGALVAANNATNYSIMPLSNGWYRYSISVMASSTAGAGIAAVYAHSNSSSGNYNGVVGSGIYVWGAQLEQASYPTSYVMTNGATASRAAEVFSQQPASYYDNTGTLQQAPANTARTNYNYSTLAAMGTLVEPASTNYVQNSQFAGFPSVGTYTGNASLGTGNHWAVGPGSIATISIVGTGYLNGVSYIDLRFQGTNSTGSTGYPSFSPVSTDLAALSSGAVSTASSWFGITSYSSSGGTCQIALSNRSYDSSKTYLTSTDTNASAVQAFAPVQTAALTHGATAAYGGLSYYIAWPNGATCDITMRIGAPQFEIGGALTSYIPTYGVGTLSRPADSYATDATGGSYFGSAGTLQTPSADTPRLDYDPVSKSAKGVLIEEERINYLRNSVLAGATTGVIGSGGAIPTRWNPLGGTDAGLTRQIVGTGTEYGMNYIDLRFNGTEAATNTGQGYYFDSTKAAPASAGQTWTGSVYARLIAGSTTGLTSLGIIIGERDASGSSVTGLANNFLSPNITSTLQRYSVARTFTGSTTMFASLGLTFGANAGAVIDFTIRLYAPQLEIGGMATSFIPTTNTQWMARARENFTIPTTAAGANGAWYTQGTGTLSALGSTSALSIQPTYPGLVSIDDGSTANAVHIIFRSNTATKAAEIVNAGAFSYNYYNGSYTLGSIFKGVIAYQDNNMSTSYSGSAVNVDTSGNIPTNLNRIRIGVSRGGYYTLNGWDQRIWYMPTREPDVSLIDYTQ